MAEKMSVDRLVEAVKGFGPQQLAEVIKFAEYTRAKAERMVDEETQAWMDADLAPPLEPYDWGGVDPLSLGKPIEWDEAECAFVVLGGKGAE